MTNALADKLELWGFDRDAILFSDGSLGFGLELTPVDASCWDTERVNAFANRVVQFLNGLTPHIDLQFVQEIGFGNSETIEKHQTQGLGAKDEIAKILADKRAAHLSALDAEGLVPRHGLKLFVRRKPLESAFRKPSFFSKAKLFEPIAESKLQAELGLLERLRDDIVAGLKSIDISSKLISSDAAMDLVYEQWNPGRSIERPPHDPDDVRSSVLFTDAGVNKVGFSLGDAEHRVISLKLLPDETFASMARVMRELPFDSRLFLTIRVPDQNQELESLKTQRRIAFSMARGKTNTASDLESEAKFQDLETLLEQMIASGEKVFHVSINVVLRSSDPDELEVQVNQTLMKLREMGGAEGMTESLAAFDIFSEFALPNARASQRAKRMKSSNLADLLPLYGPWPGHPNPSILLRSRMGSLVRFDPFSPDLTNYNQIVSGGSGSGKSFLTNVLLLHLLKENPRIFIVDIGGSYKKLCENLSGQYIPIGSDTELSLNPFDLAPGEVMPSSHKIKFLLGLVELMTKEEGMRRLPRFAQAEIENAIQRCYLDSKEPILSDLRALLLKHSSPEIQKYGSILGTWCGDTPFGRLVDRKTTMCLDRPLISFDLKGMEGYPDLQAVTLFIITDYVWREAQRDKATKKILVLDEAWKLLENEAGSAFIAEVFRTFRKYLASAIAISQNVDDFAKSRVSEAILSNSATKWILMQKGADQARLKEVLQFNDSEMELIASLHQERGAYSEVFLIAENDRSVVVVEPTPLEYWIATTDPRDVSLLEERRKNAPGLTSLELLMKLAEDYPSGVLARS